MITLGSDHFRHCVTFVLMGSPWPLLISGVSPNRFLKLNNCPLLAKKRGTPGRNTRVSLLIAKSHCTKNWPGLQCIWPSPDIATCIYSWDSPFVALSQTDKSQAKERTCSKYCFGAPSLLVLVSKFMDFSIFFSS